MKQKFFLHLNPHNRWLSCFRHSTPILKKRLSRFDWRGLTLIELLIAMAIVGILAAIAVPSYMRYRDNSDNAKAIQDIRCIESQIERYWPNHFAFPDSLSDLEGCDFTDPWGNPYEYLPVEGAEIGELRKDHNMVPVNSDYDLYSKGKDGKSASPFTSENSQDDIVRARDGSYLGLVSNY